MSQEPTSHRAIFRHEPRWGHWFVPSLRARVRHERGGYFVVTNAAGARSSAEFGPRTPDRTRVLVLGDSFTAGDGVDNAERFTDLLGAWDPGLEVLNLGLPGSGTDQQSLVHDAFAGTLQPDVLVLAPLVENIRRNVAHFRRGTDPWTSAPVLVPKPYFSLDGDRLELRNVPVPRSEPESDVPEGAVVDEGGRYPAVRRLVNEHAPSLKPWLARLGGYQPHPEYSDRGHPAWRLMAAIVRRIAERSNARVKVLAPLPYYLHVEGLVAPNYVERFAELARDAGMRFLDVLPDFLALPRHERRACRYGSDIHYTPRAHEVVARSLAAVLGARPGPARS